MMSSGSGQRDDDRTLSTLREWWRLVAKRRWIVLTTFAMVVTVSVLHSFLVTPRYRAAALLQITPKGPSVLTSKEMAAVDPSHAASYFDFYYTQPMILASRNVARLAGERLDLVNRPEFAERKGTPIGRLKQRLIRWSTGGAEEQGTAEQAMGLLKYGLSVEPIRNTQLVEIAFVDRSPELARDVVNAIAEAYIEFDFSSWRDTASVAREFLTKEVVRAQQDIAELETQLQEYTAKERILAVSEGSADFSEQALGNLNLSYVDTLGRLAIAEAHLRAVRETPAQALPEVLNSPLIQGMRQEYARIERRHGQLSERFRPDWPQLADAREELEQTRQRLRIEVETIAEQVRDAAESDYLRTKNELENLDRQLSRQKDEVQRVQRAAVRYAGLRATIESRRQMLGDLVARQSATDSSARLRHNEQSNIRFVERAQVPTTAHTPRRKRNVTIGLLFGAFLGFFMAFVLDLLDNSVKNENDLQRVADLPALGHVPIFQSLRVVSDPGDKAEALDDSPELEPALASHRDTRTAFVEAFKNIRTSLLLALPDHPPRQIAVTSCEAADGKSTVAVNLATVLSQLGRRVLLIDADLRRPRLQTLLGLDRSAGLSSVLSGNGSIDDVIQETEIPNLQAVTCGPIPPNPADLLDSPALTSLLHHLHTRSPFDHVIFDSPPLVSLSDPVTLASKMDATVLVVRAGKTSRTSLARAAARLRHAKAHVVGAVLNAVNATDQHYYYGTRYYSDQSDRGGKATPRKRKTVIGARLILSRRRKKLNVR